MGKLKINPDFADGGAPSEKEEVLVDEELLKGDEEEKETPSEEEGEEGDHPESSTGKEPIAESDDGEPEKGGDASEKERELRGLEVEENKLDKDLSDIELRIKEKRESIVAKRAERREAKKAYSEEEKSDEIDISDVDPEEMNRLERVLKAKGYIPKSEIQAEQYKLVQQDAEESFYEKYPQYKPENDKDDALYNVLQREIKMFARPANPRDVAKILEKAHLQVKTQYPSRFAQSKSNTETDAAKRARLNLAGSGAGNSGASAKTKVSNSNLTQQQIAELKRGGFSDEEIAEM